MKGEIHEARQCLSCNLSLAALLVFVATALAQTAQVTGRITDASGAVVPGAQITLTNQATGLNARLSPTMKAITLCRYCSRQL